MYLGIIDADVIAYRVAASSEEDTEQEALNTLDAYVHNLKEDCKCDNYVFLLSGKDNFRESVAKTKPYKGNRKDKQKPRHLAVVRQGIVDNYKGYVIDRFEADDLVVSLADQFPFDSVIISVDKDLKQQKGYHYNLMNGELTEISEEEAHYNLWKQVITGDSTDNIPGIPGVGEAKAKKYLGQYSKEEYPKVVYELYKEKGIEDIFREQFLLIKMKKDISVGFVNVFDNFIQFEFDVVEDWDV